MITRRTLLALPVFGQVAFARESAASFHVGKTAITIFSDGVFTLPIQNVYPTLTQADLARLALSATQVMNTNIAYVDTGVDKIIIDTGGGYNFLTTLGKLPQTLEKAGVNPETITKVILTHAHPDHLWGALDEFNTPTFPKATYYIHKHEFEHWINPAVIANASESSKNLAAGTHRILKVLEPQLEAVLPSKTLANGITFIETFGHTPGHCSVLIESGNEKVVITGDAINSSTLSFSNPELDWGMDNDKNLGTQSRKRLLSLLATDKIPLLGYHFPDNGLGRAEKAGLNYKFTPL